MKPGSTRWRLVVAALLAVALLCAYGVTSAGAAKQSSTSSTLIFKPPNNFSGDLSSPNARCLAARIVTLFYLGHSGNETPQFVEAAKTDSSGHFEINTIPDAVEGDYQVSIQKRKIKKKGKVRVICQSFLSMAQRF